MKKKIKDIFILAIAGIFFYSCQEGIEKGVSHSLSDTLVKLINPFIGTGGRGWFVGSCTPAAVAPFGMVMVGPDTFNSILHIDPYHCSGYHADDNIILGFSHNHLSGTGISDLGSIRVMPVIGPIVEEKITEKGYRSHFLKEDEFAEPGYYSVILKDSGIKVEITVSDRCGYHRYTYPNDTEETIGYVLFDLEHIIIRGKTIDANIEIMPDNRRVVGWAWCKSGFSSRFGGYTLYFDARFNKPIKDYGTWREGRLYPENKSEHHPAIGAYLGFDLSTDNEVEMRIGLSYISVANATRNLETEIPDWGLEEIREETLKKWTKELAFIKFEGGTPEQREIMATALYHCFLMPHIFTDCNGEYLGFDKEVHIAEGFQYYATFSLWDTYRTLHPLMALFKPQRQLDMVRSLILMGEQGGYLPKWPLLFGYTNCMIGTSADIVIADTYLKGITDFDVKKAYELMKLTALGPTAPGHPYEGRSQIEEYLKYGYVPVDKGSGSVSKTQEYTIADASIAVLAKALRKNREAEVFIEHSKFYKNLWDPETKFFRAKDSNGNWYPNFDPTKDHTSYTEGTGWQYRWLVPHDVQGLIELFGSKEAFIQELETFFEMGKYEYEQTDWENMNDLQLFYYHQKYYWHSNEPDLHAAYLFIDAGRPDLTQKWVHWIRSTQYSTDYDGLAGNDDCGTLSAWYVFSAMGIYPVLTTSKYYLGTPLFPKMEIQLQKGKLIIEAPEVSETNFYVRQITFNGKKLQEPYIEHKDLIQGGVLHFDMSPVPAR